MSYISRLPCVHRGDAQPLDHASFYVVVASEIGPGPQDRAPRWSIHCMVLYCRLLAEIVKPALMRGLHYQHTFSSRFVQCEDVSPPGQAWSCRTGPGLCSSTLQMLTFIKGMEEDHEGNIKPTGKSVLFYLW